MAFPTAATPPAARARYSSSQAAENVTLTLDEPGLLDDESGHTRRVRLEPAQPAQKARSRTMPALAE